MAKINEAITEKIQEVIQYVDTRCMEIDKEKSELLKIKEGASNMLKGLSTSAVIHTKIPIILANTIYGDYPVNGQKNEKIVYIIRKHGHAMLRSEIEKVIEQEEGANSKTLNSLYHWLRNVMILSGEIAWAIIAKSNKHSFFVLPEFLDENKRLKPQHYPTEESWGHLVPEKRKKIETTKWTCRK